MRSAVELAKDWRTDRVLRRLEAMLAVADRESSLIITGMGDVIEPELGLIAIGSGRSVRAGRGAACSKTPSSTPRASSASRWPSARDLCIYTTTRIRRRGRWADAAAPPTCRR